ncbi:MAG: ATP-dependent helicase C-terminal domain-containing protein [Chitinophagales bacterium]
MTHDLASFWRDTYFEVRKELKIKYHKHAWPENPLEAEPGRETKVNVQLAIINGQFSR